jgi:hypothetical protein
MRRLEVIVVLGAVLGLLGGVLTASPALARGPGWTFQPAAPFTLDASFCGFPVYVAYPVDKEYSKLLKTLDGSTITLITGSLVSTQTNLNTGKTITENVSGPGKFTTNPDGSATLAAKGRNGPISITPADAQRFGLPAVMVTAGALTISLDPNGNITSLSLQGQVLVDVCAALS